MTRGKIDREGFIALREYRQGRGAETRRRLAAVRTMRMIAKRSER